MSAPRRIAFAVVLFTAFAVAKPSLAQTRQPLDIAVVLSVTTAPLYEPSGAPSATAPQRLATLADGLAQFGDPALAGVPIDLALSPVLCDELAQFAGPAAARVRADIRMLAARMTVLSAPYANVRLPHLGRAARLRYQIAAGRQTLRTCTGTAPAALLAPPDLVLDGAVVAALPGASVTAALASEEAVRFGPAPTHGVVVLPSAPVPATDAPNDVLYRFRNHQAAAAIVQPAAAVIDLLAALRNDPHVRLRTTAELIAAAQARTVVFPSVPRPPASYLSFIDRAARAVANFRSYTRPTTPLAAVLRAAYARAWSSADWNADWDEGSRRARRIVATVDAQRRLVGAENDSVTFTSRRGAIPVTVRNRATYAVRLRVGLASPKLAFPDGPSRVVTVAPPGATVVFVALARSTGSFPVDVRLTSPTGSVHFDTAVMTVRSVATNVPALVLTGGGAVFLFVWYLQFLRRRRRQREGRNA